MRSANLRCAFVIITGYSLAFGQQLPLDVQRSRADFSKATVSVATDKSAYLPGEALRLSVSITNSTVSVLQILDPFDIGSSGGIDLWRWDDQRGPAEWKPTAPHPNYQSVRRGLTPVLGITSIAAGQRIERSWDAMEKLSGDPARILQRGSAPLEPGRYKIVYNSPTRPEAVFSVENASFVAGINILIPGQRPRTHYDPAKLPPGVRGQSTDLLGASICAMQTGAGHWLTISRGERAYNSRSFRSSKGSPMAYSDLIGLAPLVVIAKLDNAVVSLGAAEANGEISITWVDVTGKAGTIRVDKQGKIVAPK